LRSKARLRPDEHGWAPRSFSPCAPAALHPKVTNIFANFRNSYDHVLCFTRSRRLLLYLFVNDDEVNYSSEFLIASKFFGVVIIIQSLFEVLADEIL
jgi:hypothetical protein